MADFICHNCGKCCGPVPIFEDERKRIENFLKKHPSIREKIKQKVPSLTCIFRDDEKGCLIYSCRPKICRAFTCSSEQWKRELKTPSGTPKLINECFGVACSIDDYKSMINELFKSTSKTS